MTTQVFCFECGRVLNGEPGYLGTLKGVKMRCTACANRRQTAHAIIPLDLMSGDRKQISLTKPRPRRSGEVSPELLDRLLGEPTSA